MRSLILIWLSHMQSIYSCPLNYLPDLWTIFLTHFSCCLHAISAAQHLEISPFILLILNFWVTPGKVQGLLLALHLVLYFWWCLGEQYRMKGMGQSCARQVPFLPAIIAPTLKVSSFQQQKNHHYHDLFLSGYFLNWLLEIFSVIKTRYYAHRVLALYVADLCLIFSIPAAPLITNRNNSWE